MKLFKYLIKHRGTEDTEIIKVKKTNENLWGLPQSWIAIIDMTAHCTETRSLEAELFMRNEFKISVCSVPLCLII